MSTQALVAHNLPVLGTVGSLDAYIGAVNRIPVLVVEDEQELARRFRRVPPVEGHRQDPVVLPQPEPPDPFERFGEFGVHGRAGTVTAVVRQQQNQRLAHHVRDPEAPSFRVDQRGFPLQPIAQVLRFVDLHHRRIRHAVARRLADRPGSARRCADSRQRRGYQ